MQLLRELPGRRVWRDGDDVVKSFERHRPPLDWLDRRRAQREIDVLTGLRALGLPVPAARGVTREGRGWCARIEWLADTRTLQEWLVDLEPAADSLARRSRRAVLCAAATALARFGAAGLDQPDWHPSNLLLDCEMRAIGIDFHKARIGRPAARLARRDALLFAVHGRELTSWRERVVALAAYLEALPSGLRRALLGRGTRSDFARALDARARAERRRYVLRELDRWTRQSGVVEVEADGTLRARRMADRNAHRFVVTGHAAERRSAWLAQARAIEHRIPAAAPERLDVATATFVIPLQARGAQSAALLDACLADRGFALRELAPYAKWTAPCGAVHLIPHAARRA